MPRKPVKPKAQRRGLSEAEQFYLMDVDPDDVPHEGWLRFDLRSLQSLQAKSFQLMKSRPSPELVEHFGDEYLTAFIQDNPGRRPGWWWQHLAPRMETTGSGDYWDGQLAKPRRRLGGTGTPSHEVLNLVPCFDRGVPNSWITEDDLDTWPDLEADAIDPENPPKFESQATYLDRHGLLTVQEKKKLTEANFEPETIDIPEAGQ